MKITKLKTQYLENPIGLSTTIPKFSYLLESAENNQYQTAYRILAASKSEKIAADEADIWDSGKVESGDNFAIEYNGKTLQSRQRVYWKVMVWDKNNQPGKWSETAYFEAGLLNTSDWTAKWIGQGDEYYGDKSVAPIVATDFILNDCDNIVSARAYISGLGLYEASINLIMN